MKSVLISIQPKWIEKIVKGEKTIEVRKSRPKIETPFKCYIYCTKAKSKWRLSNYDGAYENSTGEIVYAQQHIVGEFICDEVYEWKYDYCDGVDIDDDLILDTCLDREDINIYAKGKTLYGWHISDLKIYDKPKELSDFLACNGKCNHCKHRVVNPNDVGDVRCENEVTRPPQSYMYVEQV